MLLISFPLLVYILLVYIFNMYLYGITIKFRLIIKIIRRYDFIFWGFLMIYMAFFIKIPIYLLHVWLLKAHVEVPVYGYIIFRVGIIDRIMTGILYLV